MAAKLTICLILQVASPCMTMTFRVFNQNQTDARMEQLARAAAEARDEAYHQLHAGAKRGHWVWWIFPTLKDHGGDENSAHVHTHCCGVVDADLETIDEAVQFAKYKTLRDGLVTTMHIAAKAFGEHNESSRGPYNVLDRAFHRSAQGHWVSGPVDAFKARCSATLFAILGAYSGDTELCQASAAVVDAFQAAGEIQYTASHAGQAGYSASTAGQAFSLVGPENPTMAALEDSLNVQVNWESIQKCEVPPHRHAS
eukprot:gnl/TRDRNA2_/TRDRNA2_192330_c0_seq1.p1 gnl/TRDRNA2_/TRDRNA2_192330_c0~~gnl/TRDRNA2_/TRDRNA2_192330_c0_seq1.p1  ORF type:complete len:255 (+),score=24.16 gnl/TRDRNA2_/TRDRNA2_192330_c0_seq1:88-852(+)